MLTEYFLWIYLIFVLTLWDKYYFHAQGQGHTADKWQDWGPLALDSTLQ